MKKIHILYFLPFAALTLLWSCDSFLDKQPSKTTSLVIQTTDHLDALLERMVSLNTTTNKIYTYGTDDCGIHMELYDARTAAFSVSTVSYLCWDMNNIAADENRGTVWANEYSKIFTANLVLNNLGNVTGPEETKEQLRLESHFLRAWSMMELVNTYCLPYTEATKDEPGLALKQTTSFEELSSRSTLEATHKMIQADLEEALKITTPVLREDGMVRHWRANKGAANALAARYWLGQGDYTQALSYAQAALDEYSGLVDYNTEMQYAQLDNQNPTVKLYFNPENTSEYEEYRVWYPDLNPLQTDARAEFDWKEYYYFRVLQNDSWWFIPSQEWLNLFGSPDSEIEAAAKPTWAEQKAVLEAAEAVRSADLRYKYHVVEGYSFDTPANMNRPPYFWYGYCFFFKEAIPYGPTVPEMILTKAECMARGGQWQEAMNVVNTLRAKRIDSKAGADVISLSATSQSDAVAKILEERRREMPFTIRWFDLRRFQINDDPSDDKTLTRTFYPFSATAIDNLAAPITYTLGKGDRRWATPLPNTEIISSNGKIEQNKY